MTYLLQGFTTVTHFRVFAFQGIGPERTRENFWVKVDMGLLQNSGVPIQDLPLLCRGALEQREEETSHTLVLTEAQIRQHGKDRQTRKEIALKKRKPPTKNVGLAWRGTQIR